MSAKGTPTAKFRLGRIVTTPRVLDALTYDEILSGLLRHITGDWGDTCPEDRAANDQALGDGARLLSAYRSAGGLKFWIITEADRSSTTVLLPEEY